MSETASAKSAHPSPPEPTMLLRRLWPDYMVTGHYFGLVSGPDESHGGAYEQEKADVKAIQQRLIALGQVPGVTKPGDPWADGLFEQPTADAVSAWQKHLALNTAHYGRVYLDDWYALFTY